jgi:hypothetical protein
MSHSFALTILLFCVFSPPRETFAAAPIDESRQQFTANPHRPIYHLSSPQGKMHDPGGFGFWQGRYHLFYIAPGGKGHAVSDDLVQRRDRSPVNNIGGLTGQMVVTETEALMSFGRGEGIFLSESSDPLLQTWARHLAVSPEFPDSTGKSLFADPPPGNGSASLNHEPFPFSPNSHRKVDPKNQSAASLSRVPETDEVNLREPLNQTVNRKQ